MKRTEQLLEALGNVGIDLVERAEDAVKLGRRWSGIVSAAACLVLLLGVGAAAYSNLFAQPQQMEQPQQTEQLVLELPDTPIQTEETLPVYLISGRRDEGSMAINADGEVVVSLAQGYLELLQDAATGKTLAIEAHTQTGITPQAGDQISLYDLEGNLLHTLPAREISVAGDTAVVVYADHAALYNRSSGSLIREELETAWVVQDLVIGISKEDPDYYLLRSDTGPMLGHIQKAAVEAVVDHEAGVQFVYRENGKLGLMDADGTMRVEPVYDEVSVVDRQWLFGRKGETWFAVNWQTGQTLELHKPQQVWDGGAVYEDAQNPGCMLFATFSYDSDGKIDGWQVHTEPCVAIEVVDDDGNGVPELLVAMEYNDHYSVWHPDGMLLNRIEADTLTIVNSRTGIGVRASEDGSGEFFLIDLKTGDERHEFAKAYDYGTTIYFPNSMEDGSRPGYFYARYYEAGEHIDLLAEDGTLLLENLATDTNPYLGDDVFLCGGNGTVRLCRANGNVLYEEETAVVDYTAFCGNYSDTETVEGPCYTVSILRADPETARIELQITYVGRKSSPVYTTDLITASIGADHTAEFEWQDSWGNRGTGILVLNPEDPSAVQLRMTVTEEAEYNRGTLATHDQYKTLFRRSDMEP